MNGGSRTSLSPEKTLEIVLESIGELVDYELAVVLMLEGWDKLSVKKTRGPLAGSRLSSYSIALSQRPDLVDLLQVGSPHLFGAEEDHIDTYAEVLDLPQGHSCLASPLMLEGKPIGLLTLDHRSCGVFSSEIVRFIGAISRLIAVALAQAEEAGALKEEAGRLAEERNRLLGADAEVFKNLAGNSPAWLEVLDSLKLVAATDSPVLLQGETGTGKEEAARLLHRLSARANQPFVAVNCSALPPALAESELFGHEKGSFTGAQALRKGRFELADGGTLFLDEIGDLPSEIQPKLLRAIQEGRFERVGGERSVAVDVRIIAATHKDLSLEVGRGDFREDLYYRIAVFPVRLPPLRERGGDAVLIAELFLSRLRSRPGWSGLRFQADALDLIESRSWPGNVRELRNAIERAAILSRGGAIGAQELGAGSSGKREAGESKPAPHHGEPQVFVSATLDEAQRRHILDALERSGGKIYGPGGAAVSLGLKPSTLQSKMKRLGISVSGRK
jgi:transcriptional regulator with GAF, ATPase, and Fis domain